MAIGAPLGSGKAGARSLAEIARERNSAETAKQELPITATKLHEPYPNPFNPRTTIRFDLHEPADVTLTIPT